jgi:hypothetical protein
MKRNAKLLKNHAAQGEFAALEAAEQFTLDEIQGWLCWSLFSARIRDISRLSKNSRTRRTCQFTTIISSQAPGMTSAHAD